MKSRWSSLVRLATDRTGCDGEDTARGYRSRSEPLAQPREVGRVLLDPAGRLTDHRRLRVPDHRGKQVRLDLSGPEVGVPVGTGVELVATVIGMDQVDPAGDGQDVVDDRLKRVATRVGVAGVEAEADHVGLLLARDRVPDPLDPLEVAGHRVRAEIGRA